MKKEFRSFEDARKFVQALKLKNRDEWERYSKSGNRPLDIPGNPRLTFKEEWASWGDFLGTGRIQNQQILYLSFNDARTFVQELEFQRTEDWYDFCQSEEMPDNIPHSPEVVYKNKGWKGIGDWLGTRRIANQNKIFRSFEDARRFVRQLEFKNTTEWFTYSKSGNKPDDIPSLPSDTYKNEWTSWEDFLGDKFIGRVEFCSFEEAKKFVQSLGLKGVDDWRKYCKSGNKPDNIPSNPWTVYKKWEGKKS